MNEAILVALISFVGTLLGTAGGIVASGKLVNYRIEQLEKKVETLGLLSARVPIIEEQIKSIKKESVLTNQLVRSGTSVGANIRRCWSISTYNIKAIG